MQIKQDPITGLWCRSDGAVLMPPCRRFPYFRWTFGNKMRDGYLTVGYNRKIHLVHRLVCRTFNGLPPSDKPEVDHINRLKEDNRPSNLRWVSRGENEGNKARVDKSVEKYGVRCCDDRKAYDKAYAKSYHEVHREKRKVYDAAKYAMKKAQGLVRRKGPDGKYGWYPRIRP